MEIETESEQIYELILNVGDGNIEESERSEQFMVEASRDEGFACLYIVSYAYLLSGLSPHVRYAYFGQEFLSSKLANHSFTHENCGA